MMDRIRQELEKGGAVVLPTETVYGLFAKALDEKAVDHVYQLKRRPRDKALNLNVASLEDILHFSKNQPTYLQKLVEAFLPGPLTKLVLECSYSFFRKMFPKKRRNTLTLLVSNFKVNLTTICEIVFCIFRNSAVNS